VRLGEVQKHLLSLRINNATTCNNHWALSRQKRLDHDLNYGTIGFRAAHSKTLYQWLLGGKGKARGQLRFRRIQPKHHDAAGPWIVAFDGVYRCTCGNVFEKMFYLMG